KAINTIAQPNILVVRDDVSEEDVYQITKTMYENLPFLNNIHPATKAMAIDKAIAGLPLPLHPGAVRYFKEQGIEIPERLIAE
ncbi:MAG: TAXI family TRAP transporter solute-binding subunit, partial [Cobetia crustatorum]